MRLTIHLYPVLVLRKYGANTSTFLYVNMLWQLILHKDNFISTSIIASHKQHQFRYINPSLISVNVFVCLFELCFHMQI
jgi:hypothetical protein